MEGRIYPSVENAYQAAKAHPSQRAAFTKCSAGAAKHLGRGVELPTNWDVEKISVMRSLLRCKFADKALAAKLIATQAEELVEGNTWGDTFWGVCRGKGDNNLGKLLMEIRESL